MPGNPRPNLRCLASLGALLAGCTLFAGITCAAEIRVTADLRINATDATPSFLRGGLGKLRSDAPFSANTSQIQFNATQHWGEAWRGELNVIASPDDVDGRPSLTEAFAEFRPYPHGGWRMRVKVGAFYAPISLENRAVGWESPYTASPSGINSWIGEEVRTVGAELQLDRLRVRIAEHDNEFGILLAAYGWNDFAGAYLAARGFRVQDRQTSLVGNVAAHGLKAYSLGPFHEADGRAGFYAGARWRLDQRLEVRAMRYDNRANPAIYLAAVDDFAWHTRFTAVGLRLEGRSGWTLISQWLQGDTEFAPDGTARRWVYDSAFVLLSQQINARHIVSLRYDDFNLHGVTAGTPPPNLDEGNAWTLAWFFQPAERWRIGAEVQRVDSFASKRRLLLGVDPTARESRLELSLRREFVFR